MQIRHVAVELGGVCVLSLGIILVHFLLKRVIRLGMGEETEEEARKSARDRVRSCDDREDTVVDEVSLGWR